MNIQQVVCEKEKLSGAQPFVSNKTIGFFFLGNNGRWEIKIFAQHHQRLSTNKWPKNRWQKLDQRMVEYRTRFGNAKCLCPKSVSTEITEHQPNRLSFR